MTTELTLLAWAVVLGLVHAVTTGQFTTLQHGLNYGLSPRDEPKALTGVGARVERAFANYMQTFPFFAAAVLIAHVAQRHSWLTVTGAHLFFVSVRPPHLDWPCSTLHGHSCNMQSARMTHDQRPLLIVFSGLPGTGKTTVSKALAAKLHAIYLRIDTVEQAMKAAGAERIGPAGYAVANALAEANLLLGHSIVADCVNPVRESRLGWSNVAKQASAKLIDIHLICSNTSEHRRRVEGRFADIPGHILPTWDSIAQQKFETRDDKHLVLDTACMSPADLVDLCDAYVFDRFGDQ